MESNEVSIIPLLNTLKIPRLILSGEVESQIQLHGFCDASEKAYDACIYLHEAHTPNKITVSLVLLEIMSNSCKGCITTAAKIVRRSPTSKLNE